jgi:bifunctional isochorismate lyase/aryl carrier protein
MSKNKEKYFSPGKSSSIAEKMIEQLPPAYRRRHRPSLDNAVLLILDMQNYFLEPDAHAFIPSAPAILFGLNKLIRAFAEAGRQVIFTRHIDNGNDGGPMKEWWRDTINSGDKESLIYGGLAIPAGSLIICKSQYDAFHGTELLASLRDTGVDTIVLAGVMTHLCCETTARSAFVRGFKVVFLADGTATYTAEHHRATLLNLAHGFAHILTVPDVLGRLAH